jgi:hypothetical protein
MPATIAEIQEIQVQVSGRRPEWVEQDTAVTATNGVPTTASDGVPTQGASGRTCVESALRVESEDNEGVTIQVWVYDNARASWCRANGGAFTLTDLGGWSEIMRTGPVDRVYIEVTAITAGTLDAIAVGPCDVP